MRTNINVVYLNYDNLDFNISICTSLENKNKRNDTFKNEMYFLVD